MYGTCSNIQHVEPFSLVISRSIQRKPIEREKETERNWARSRTGGRESVTIHKKTNKSTINCLITSVDSQEATSKRVNEVELILHLVRKFQ